MSSVEGWVDGQRQRRREERSLRAVSAAVEVARGFGLRVAEPVVLADLFSLMVHLQPAPVVARVATCMPTLRSPIEYWLGLELEVTAFLAGQGAPVVAPSSELPPGPHTSGGFSMSFWTYLEPDPDRTVTTADCAAMLVDLHTVLRSYPGELPSLCATDIPRGMQLLDQAGDVLSTAEVDLLRASAEELAPFLADPGGRSQPLHGDAHPGNLIATRDGLVWIDFEDVSRGPIEWDLASMMDAGVTTTHHQPDPDLLARCDQLRALQVALALITFYDDFGDQDGWDTGLRHVLGTLADHRM
jgi:aminoglycoside phosphotransferase (APT) family kinase protein